MKQRALASSTSAGATSALLNLPGLHDAVPPACHGVIRLIMAMAEREAAVLEKNVALAEKKTALAQRDSALLQRDLAIADRASALSDRDRAMQELDLIRAEQEACPRCQWKRQCVYGGGGGGPKCFLMLGVPENVQPLAATDNLEDLFSIGDALPCKKKRMRGEKPKEVVDAKANAPQKLKTRTNLPSPAKPTSKALNRKPQQAAATKQVDPNEVAAFPFDFAKLSNPYCSCTGINEQCYRWGYGGWQSACCTNTISMHPLPMNPKKKGCRLAGRKMSAGAFVRLILRLVSDGWDANMPLDLKDYWAKHGTNMYVTIK